MYLSEHLLGKKAELDNPPVQAITYMESPGWEGDTAVYAEPWGGQQLNVAPQINGDIEMDPAMTLQQGERPELDSDFYTQPYRTAGENPSDQPQWAAPWGEAESVNPSRSVGGADPTSDGVGTVPSGLPQDGFQTGQDQPPFAIGDGHADLADMGDPWNSPAGPGIVQASSGKSTSGGTATSMDIDQALKEASQKLNPIDLEASIMEDLYRKLASDASVAKLVTDPEVVACSKQAEDSDTIKLASMDQLFSFDVVATDRSLLIHKSTNDLWKIALDEEGNPVLKRAFNPSSLVQG
jgi:hypothetical protein